jgi:predicted DNA-binding transcriptional regulator YafY
MRTGNGYRNRMRDQCVALHGILLKRREIGLYEAADELGVSPDTVRRWVTSFSLVMPVEIRRGVILVDGGRTE